MPPVSPWTTLPPVEPSDDLLQAFVGQTLLAETLARRGIATEEEAWQFLSPRHYAPAPPCAMAGVAEATRILRRGFEQGQRILVWGDFDADGQTSTALLAASLRTLSQQPDLVRWHVPHRIRDNHGIQPARVREWLDDAEWKPDILVTCDTGIDAEEGLAVARAAGLRIIVTDHHDLPPAFNDAEPGVHPVVAPTADAAANRALGIRPLVDAIINPKLMPPEHPQATLPGVGVAFLLALELFTQAQRAEEAWACLDLVALGIVADLAEQVRDTRYWLQRGLAVLNQVQRPGLQALLADARATPGALSAEDIAFTIAPRMNAAGRLDDAALSVRLLLTRDPEEARRLAVTMDTLNRRRKEMSARLLAEATAQWDANPAGLDPRAIVLAHKNWHPGILGPAASQLAERYQLPTVLLHIDEDNQARGSARSVPGVDIGAALGACRALLTRYGGHEQAAGLSLPVDRLDRFRRALQEAVPRHSRSRSQNGLVVDREIPLADVDRDLWKQLQALEPTGRGNPEVVLMSSRLAVEGWKTFSQGSIARFKVRQQGHPFAVDAVWFRPARAEAPSEPVDLAYHVRLNEFRGLRKLELHVRALRIPPRPAPSVTDGAAAPEGDAPFRIEDMRHVAHPPALKAAATGAVWYAEGLHLSSVERSTRVELKGPADADCLVLWTSPPDDTVLKSLLAARSWKTVAVWTQDVAEPDAAIVVRKVFAMCKYAVQQNEGRADVTRMAAQLGVTESAVKLGLELLERQARIRFAGDAIHLSGPPAQGDWNSDPVFGRLQWALREIGSFRYFFRKDNLENFLL